ncbi:MAG: YihY/virulence factor BrkB family protein [Vicingaceae bacterium]
MKVIARIRTFIEREIWLIDLNKVKGPRKMGIRLIRSLFIALRDFKRDNCQLKASALTFYTLLSIVPVIAMLFGIAKGFGLEKKLEAEIGSDISYNQEVLQYVFELANNMLENTRGGVIAGIGVALLFWSVMKLLGNIEEAFNDIWEIKSSRSLVRKFSDYLSIVLVAPVLTILSGSATVFISTQLSSAANSIEILGFFGPIIYYFLSILPLFITTLLFAAIYMILPNTKVNFGSALFGAFIAAIIFSMAEWVYLSFQIGVSKYNAIYGGFAALPLFLIFVQTLWLILLLGAELSFGFQNQGKYEFEMEASDISNSFRFLLSVIIVKGLVKKFKSGETAPSTSELSEGLQIPAKLIRKIIFELVEAKIISELNLGEKEESRYQPAIDIAMLDVDFIRRQLNDKGLNELPIERNEEFLRIESAITDLQIAMKKSPSNKLISDL